jgi:diguanylate cyclase (GGDEF)-like protein
MPVTPSAPAAEPAVPLPRPLGDLVHAALHRWRSQVGPPGRDQPAAIALADAITTGAVRVAYQPIVALETRRAVAAEALVRIDRPRHAELVDATGIIGVAEASGLITAVGTSVLVQACTQLAAWQRDEHQRRLQMHVNISPHQLRDERIVEVVERTLALTRLAPSSLVLEVTETAAFEGDGLAEATLTSLTALGVEIAIDDFGTGFASLELLASTPARSMKLDRTFTASVGDVGEAPRGRALMVQAAIGLGHALGLRVVAEGVESEVQARTLSAWGCNFGQGYLFARASRPDELSLRRTVPAPLPTPSVRSAQLGLSDEATHLALATATVLAETSPGDAERRADAMACAVVLAEGLACDRWDADTAAVLAALVDDPARLDAVLAPTGGSRSVTELRDALAAPAALTRGADQGALAEAARSIARQRHEQRALEDILASFSCPIDPALRDHLASWWQDRPVSPSALDELAALERRLRHRDDAGRRLRSLTALTQAIGRSGSLEDVLELTAEEARAALGAASLSIARLERDRSWLRVLVNVGDLATWEDARPAHEVYDLSDRPLASARLIDRAVHIELASADQAEAPAGRLLAASGKGSSLAVPIVIGGATWGEVYATTALGEPPFTMADAPFGIAVANVVGSAIQGSEEVEQLGRLAGEDPLTHLANRRQLEQRLAELLEEGVPGDEVGLLMLDVDRLKDINDEYGHAEGDALLVRIADVLSRVTLTVPGALAARLAGDEFCMAVPGAGQGIDAAVARLRQRLEDGPPPRPRLSAGFATVRVGQGDAGQLLRRADAAQYRARWADLPLVRLSADQPIPATPSVPALREPQRRRSLDPDDLGPASTAAITRWRSMLASPAVLPRLEAIGDAAVALLDLNRWVLSEAPTGGPTLHLRRLNIRRRSPGSDPFPPSAEQVYRLEDFPRTVEALRTGRGFAVHVDDASGDPTERAVLAELGNRYVVLLTERDEGGDWVLELYGDAHSAPFEDAVAVIEALATRALGREVRCAASR